VEGGKGDGVVKSIRVLPCSIKICPNICFAWGFRYSGRTYE